MERYCISLEQAKKISQYDDFGAAHYWLEVDSLDKGTLAFFDELPSWLDHRPRRAYPALHVGELGEILRDWVIDIDFIEGEKVWWITNNEVPDQVHPTEAQARGAYLIYLLEKGKLNLL